MNIKIKEVSIEYFGRSYKKEKIKVSDGIKVLTTLIKYRFLKKMKQEIKKKAQSKFGLVFFWCF